MELSQYWLRIQRSLFPWLKEELGELTEKDQKLVTTLELIRIERFVAFGRSLYGRPLKERAAIARAFVAKAVYNMPTTRALLDRLACDKKLRRICGWERKGERYQVRQHSPEPLRSFLRPNYRHVFIRH